MSNCQDRSVGPGPLTLTPSGTGNFATSGGPPSGTGSALVVVVVFTSLGAVPLGSGGREVDAEGDGSASGFGASSAPPQPAPTGRASSDATAAAGHTGEGEQRGACRGGPDGTRAGHGWIPPAAENGRRRRYRTDPRELAL